MQLPHHDPGHIGHAARDPGDAGVRLQDQGPHADCAPAIAGCDIPGYGPGLRLPGHWRSQSRGEELNGEPLTGPGAACEGDPLTGGGAHLLRTELHDQRA